MNYDKLYLTEDEIHWKSPVISIADFKKKYGNQGEVSIQLIEEFIKTVPDFEGGKDFYIALGIMTADLKSALRGP